MCLKYKLTCSADLTVATNIKIKKEPISPVQQQQQKQQQPVITKQELPTRFSYTYQVIVLCI